MANITASLAFVVVLCCYGSLVESIIQADQTLSMPNMVLSLPDMPAVSRSQMRSRQTQPRMPSSPWRLSPQVSSAHDQLTSLFQRTFTNASPILSRLLLNEARAIARRIPPQYQPDSVQRTRETSRHSPGTRATGRLSPFTQVTGRLSPITRETGRLSPITQVTGRLSPFTRQTGRLSPITLETGRLSPVDSPHGNIQLTPISWPANKTVSIPVRLPSRGTSMRSLTSPKITEASLKVSGTKPVSPTKPATKGGPVSSLRNRVRSKPIPVNATRDQKVTIGVDLLRQLISRTRPMVPLEGKQHGGTSVRTAPTLRQTGNTSRDALTRYPASGYGKAVPSLPTFAAVSKDSLRKDSQLLVPTPIVKQTSVSILPKTTGTATKRVASIPSATGNPYDTFNENELIAELNITLGQYGLDVDRLITLLQGTKGGKKSTSREGLAKAAGSGRVSKPGVSGTGGAADNATQILADLQRELEDITHMLEAGNSGYGGHVRDQHHRPRPLIESTGNPYVDEQILQLMLAAVNQHTHH